MSGYNTAGRQKLIEFLKSHSEEPLTVTEIHELITTQRISPASAGNVINLSDLTLILSKLY